MPPLVKETVSFTFSGGVDTKRDPFTLPMGKLTSLINGEFKTPGRITKRNGYGNVSNSILGGGTVAAGSMLATRGSELVLADGSSLFSWDASNSAWVTKGSFVGTSVTQQPVARPNYYVYGQDCARHSSGIVCYVYEQWAGPGNTLQGVFYSLVDSTTNQVVKTGTVDTGGAAPKVITVGSQFAIIYVSAANPQHLQGRTLSATSPLSAISSATALDSGTLGASATLGNLGGCFDACLIGSTLYVSFHNSTGGATTISFASGALWSQVNSISTAGGIGMQTVGLFADSFQSAPVLIFSDTSFNTKFAAYHADLSTTFGTGTIDTAGALVPMQVCGISTSGASLQLTVFWAFYQSAASGMQNSLIKTATISGSYAVSGVKTLSRSVNIAGKPLLQGGAAYIPASYSTGSPTSGCGLQPTNFLLNTSGAVVARWLYGLGNSPYYNGCSNNSTTGSTLPETLSLGGGAFLFPSLATDLLTSATGRVYSQTGLNAVTVTFGVSGFRVEEANSLHMGGGILTQYDGQSVVEHNFHLYPDPVTVSTNGAGGSILPGTYQYVACYAWMDAQGNMHRSTPSTAVSITTVGNTSTNTVTIPMLRLTAKSSTTNPVFIEVYRTLANGTTFYLVNVGNFAGTSGQLANDPTADTVTCTDKTPDTGAGGLNGNSQLYTTGNVVQDSAPNPLGHLIVHQNRIFGIDTTNPLQLFYTKQIVPPTTGVAVPAEFSQSFTYNVDPRGGGCTAIASMDEKLIIFKDGLVFVDVGQGPDSTGGQNGYTGGVLIAADVGCVTPKSVVLTKDGLQFQSRKGLMLLTRDLRVEYIGAEAEALFPAGGVVSANVIPSTNQIRFGLNNNTVAVYDTLVGQWAIFNGGAFLSGIVDSTIWQNAYVFLNSAGTVRKEVTGQYNDYNQQFYGFSWTTGWLSFAGFQGFQRVYRMLILGSYSPDDPQTQTVPLTISHDFATAGQQVVTNWGTLQTAPDFIGNIRIAMQTQKCESVQVAWSESAPQGSALGAPDFFSGLTFEVGIKRGAFRLPAASTYG